MIFDDEERDAELLKALHRAAECCEGDSDLELLLAFVRMAKQIRWERRQAKAMSKVLKFSKRGNTYGK